ncbi:hypothetical protein QBZ16_001301 [Prototheca wickerhamii]|uniref:Uncharacterized protein n=1 Tax=Prototheca wickerhamii TaxID=3111 RepID=A0AAD9IG08_PROWI|nr:hypothetical protein QBZ16_001301 [Prototheca wickerhamii]
MVKMREYTRNRILLCTQQGLLVHARLRAVRASTGPAGPLSGLEAPVTRLHALPKSAPLRASGTGPLLFGEPQDERYGSAASVSGSAAGAVSDSLGREDAGSISAGSSEGSDLTTDSVDVAQLGASEPVGSWAAAAAPGVLLGTLGLAVEWLLQAPKEARRGAVLRAAQLLVAFVVQRPRPGGAAGEGGPADGRRRGVPAASSASHRWAGARWARWARSGRSRSSCRTRRRRRPRRAR